MRTSASRSNACNAVINRHTANQLRNQAEFDQILMDDLFHDRGKLHIFLAADCRFKTEGRISHPVFNDFFDSIKGAAADE